MDEEAMLSNAMAFGARSAALTAAVEYNKMCGGDAEDVLDTAALFEGFLAEGKVRP